MLPERHRELLTAYVDGELPSRQRPHLARLLRRSGEARALLRQLQTDALALRRLSPVPAPADLADNVLAQINLRRLKPAQPRPAPVARYYPAWAGVAAAAAVLLVVSLGSFFYFSRPGQDVGSAGVVRSDTPGEKETDQPGPKRPEPRLARKKHEQLPPPRPRTGEDDDDTGTTEPERQPKKKPRPKKERPGKPDSEAGPVFTTGQKEPFHGFEKVELDLPTVHRLANLAGKEQRQALLTDLGKGGAFRVELPCRDGSRAFERLQPLLAGARVGLVIDPTAQARLKKSAFRTDYALFLENVPAVLLADLLAQLHQAEKAGLAQKPADRRFHGPVVLRPVNARDRKELTELLGIDPVKVRPGKPSTIIDPRKSLTDQTQDAVTAALEGRGVPRPTTGKGPEHQALLLALNPARSRPGSAVLKRFLAGRRPPKAGTVQVFLVLRSLGN